MNPKKTGVFKHEYSTEQSNITGSPRKKLTFKSCHNFEVSSLCFITVLAQLELMKLT